MADNSDTVFDAVRRQFGFVERADFDFQSARQRLNAEIANDHARRRRSRWQLRAISIRIAAVAVLAIAILAVGISVSTTNMQRDVPVMWQGETAAGVLASLDISKATAAEVIRAAGRDASVSSPPTRGRWGYSQTRHRASPDQSSVTETWSDPSERYLYSISEERIAGVLTLKIRFEDPANGIVGEVRWDPEGDPDLRGRKAIWQETPPNQRGESTRRGLMYERLASSSSSADVERALIASLDLDGVTFMHGAACYPGESVCHGFTAGHDHPGGQDAERRHYMRSALVHVLATRILPADAMRASYDWLAEDPDAQIADSTATIVDVVFPVDGLKASDWERLRFDRDTGRLVSRHELRRASTDETTWVEVGTTPQVAEGGRLCAKYTGPCDELVALSDRRSADSEARFQP